MSNLCQWIFVIHLHPTTYITDIGSINTYAFYS